MSACVAPPARDEEKLGGGDVVVESASARLAPGGEARGEESSSSSSATVARLARLLDGEHASSSTAAAAAYGDAVAAAARVLERGSARAAALHARIGVEEAGIASYAGALCALKVALLEMKQRMDAERDGAELRAAAAEEEEVEVEVGSPLEAILRSFKLKGGVVSSPEAPASSDIINEVTTRGGSGEDASAALSPAGGGGVSPKQEESLRRALLAVQYELEHDDGSRPDGNDDDDGVEDGADGEDFEYHRLRDGVPWLHGAIRRFVYESDGCFQRRAPAVEEQTPAVGERR